MNKKYTICIGENHAIFREGIKSLLSTNPQYSVIGEGEDGMSVINVVQENLPDILLLDLTMPKMNGMDVIKVLKKRYPDLKILVLTIHNTEDYIHAALAAGANGYVLKDANYAELTMAINVVLNNKTYLDPAASDKVVQHYLSNSKKTSTGPVSGTLTTRELEILKLIAEAYTNKRIAEYLNISIKTVEKHRANLMRKLNLHSASELTTFAIQKGLVERT
jgi:DNA-binding NarL/FixJ family response regulator